MAQPLMRYDRTMTKIDRRRGSDRRENDRHGVSIDIQWENLAGRRPGTVNDLSVSGCFLLSGGEVEDGDTIKIYFPSREGEQMQVWGRIVNHVFEVGFAVRFVNLTEQQSTFLSDLIESIRIG